MLPGAEVAAGGASFEELSSEGQAPAAQKSEGSRVPAGPLWQRDTVLRARLRAAPTTAGVYLFRGPGGEVIYVGKSARLRDRLRSYFVSPAAQPARTHRMVASAFDFEVIACPSEQEALLLENTLIKRYRPRFNVRLRDDKNYLYLEIPRVERLGGTPPAPTPAVFPRPAFSRRMSGSGRRYFGPFTDAKALRRSVRELRGVFPFRGCPDAVFRRGRVCLDYHLKICAGPCEGLISREAYGELLDDAADFMAGRTHAVTERLAAEMGRASAELDFERAAALRDRLQTVQRLNTDRALSPGARGDLDVVGIATEPAAAMASVLTVREGRVQGAEWHALEGTAGLEVAELLGSFLSQYYTRAASIPPELLVPMAPPELEVLEGALSLARGGKVTVRVPRRGRPLQLLGRATATAEAGLTQARVTREFDGERVSAVLQEVRERLGLNEPPRRIECYDISNTMGSQSVGSMVVFEDGRAKPSDYRIFGIRTVEGPNDFASMEEVIGRRFHHLSSDSAVPDASFGTRPDLVIVDGGSGQLASAKRALDRAGLTEMPIFGLAKRFEELVRVEGGDPVRLPQGSDAMFLIQRIRDEAHRFAITGHRTRRQKAGLRSRLDEITGIGPSRKRALLRHFGSLEAMRQASLDELLAVPGITRPVAVAIKELL